jgi:nitroreductase
MKTETLNLLANRQSLRVYDKKPVPLNVRQSVINAALSAPTAGALMLYAIIEVNDTQIKEALAISCDNQPFIAQAPWLLLFAADYQRLWDSWQHLDLQVNRTPGVGDLFLSVCDALIAAQTAVIAAEAVGLGSCYIGDIIENAQTHRALLHLPEYVFPAALLCLGYPPEGYHRPHTRRLPSEMILHSDRYIPKETPDIYRFISERGHTKFTAPFSEEMTRSMEIWLSSWMAETPSGKRD